MELYANESLIKEFRPTLRSVWFLWLGIMLGPAIIIFERDPHGHPAKWVILSLVCLSVIIHRMSLRYTLTDRRVIETHWWGRGAVSEVSLANLHEIKTSTSLVGRLVDCAHLDISSRAYNEPGFNILGQNNYRELAATIEQLVEEAKKRGDDQGA